ncbi:hypothetical protein TNCV_2791551 [Trichonephila clavipes]|nr:hypothetical protein TNCV_2791551 [Trichonephila clavipes]
MFMCNNSLIFNYPHTASIRIIKGWNEIKPDIIKEGNMDNNLDGTEDDYLFMNHSNSDGKDETEFDEVPEDITKTNVTKYVPYQVI